MRDLPPETLREEHGGCVYVWHVKPPPEDTGYIVTEDMWEPFMPEPNLVPDDQWQGYTAPAPVRHILAWRKSIL